MLNQFNDWIVDLGMNISRLLRFMKTSDGRDVMLFSEILQQEKEQDDCVERKEKKKKVFQMREVVEEMGWNVRNMV